jgi:branched-subunit amino acid aminotransferase/4-amino-4-deoxychorismate lyase
MSHVSESIPTCILTSRGLAPTPYRVGSLSEAVAHEPCGVYTVARTFRGDHALLLDAHLDRLEQSAQLVNIPLTLDRAGLRGALRDMLHRASYPDAKFRITVPQDGPDRIYLAIEPYKPVPDTVMQQGAQVITVSLVRQNPVVKATEWMTIRKPTFDSLPPSAYEAILTASDGRVLEGLSSNFYGVLDGVLYTAGGSVLAGITRHAILELAPEILPVSLTALCLSDVPRLSEAMLTSSSRGVVPITVMDGHPVGDGGVGSLVTRIRRGYDAWADAHSEPI